MRSAQRTVVVMTLAASLGWAVLPAWSAQAPAAASSSTQKATRHFSVPGQTLADALKQFAVQSDMEILFTPKDTAQKRSSAVQGEYPPTQALDILLGGTGLRYRVTDGDSIVIEVPRGTAVSGAPAGLMRVATSAGASQANPAPLAQEAMSAAGEESAKGIPEILVKGKRAGSMNVDIPRTEDDIQPYVVFDRAQIERSMAVDIEGLLKSRLPMNTVTSTWSQETSTINGNQSQINLRGLGTNQTLILVNGRRLPDVSKIVANGQFSQPDINGIPLSAVERIEVLPSTAGGIYGGGATGGVVNIILRRDYRGFEMRALYTTPFDTDAARRQLDFQAGFSLEEGKTQVMLTGSMSDQNQLMNGDRDYALRSRQKMLERVPEEVYYIGAPPTGYTTNIRNSSDDPLRLDSGAVLASAYTSVPVGYGGVSTDNGQALRDNAGKYNLDLPDTAGGAGASLISGPLTRSLSASVRRNFGARLEGFVDVNYNDNAGRTFGNQFVPRNVTLQADAPNNPFNSMVYVSFPSVGATFERVSKTRSLNALAGMILRLPGDWFSELDYSWNRSRQAYAGTSPEFMRPTLDPRFQFDPALNVMRDLNLAPLDYSAYALPSPNNFYGPSDTVLRDATLRVAGPTFRLPAGPVTLSGLYEYRRQDAKAALRRGVENSGALYGQPFTEYYFPRQLTVKSFYLEAQAPLISAHNALPGVHELSVQVSTRHDDYATVSVPRNVVIYSNSTRPPPVVTYFSNQVAARSDTLGFRYSPVKDVALRASYGTGFLPPAIHQIAPTMLQNIDRSSYRDPRRGNTPLGLITLAQEGNAELLPEDSRSWSAGLIVTPRQLSNLRLSVDYTRIEKTNEIGRINTPVALSDEAAYPGRVVRAPLTPADAALGYTGGVITTIYEGAINFAFARVEAFDVQADYVWETGRGDFSAFLLFTRQNHFQRRAAPTSTLVDSAGHLDGPLKLRGNGGLAWQRDGWTLGWNVQFYDAYFIYPSTAGPADLDFYLQYEGFTQVPRQAFHDAFAKYRFDAAPAVGGHWLADTEIMLGIQNVFNKGPTIFASTQPTAYVDYYADARLRSYQLSLRKNW